MIAFLQGRLLEKHPNRIVLDVQGVGYDVQVPLSTFYDLPGVDVPVSLRIHTHVREDQIALFGFATALQLQLFERLMTVSGIGPRVALAVLSGIEPADLVRAVRTADVTETGRTQQKVRLWRTSVQTLTRTECSEANQGWTKVCILSPLSRGSGI